MLNRELDSALAALVNILAESRDSLWASQTVATLRDKVETIRTHQSLTPLDRSALEHLCAPTGPLQETSIDNGWGEEFLRLAAIVDRHLG